jgi:hypothetical protein
MLAEKAKNQIQSPAPPDAAVTNTLLVLPGCGDMIVPCLRSIAHEFDWHVETADTLIDAATLAASQRIVAVFFHREALGPDCSWTDALHLLSAILPESRLIPCHGFSEPTDWSQLSDAGAFYFLWLPLKENELRQCVGFVWQTAQNPGQTESPVRVPVRNPLSLPPAQADRSTRKTALAFYSAA